MERILLNPSEWWIGKKDGKLLAMMFGHRAKDGTINVEWEVLDESNLPADLIRCDGIEYTFLIPVGVNGHAAVEEVTAGLRSSTPELSADTGPEASGASSDFDTMTLAEGVCGDEVSDGGPVAGVAGHNVGGFLNSSTNVKEHAPALATPHAETGGDA